MDVSGNNSNNAALLTIYTRHDVPNQHFRYEPVDEKWGYLVAVHSGKVLDVLGEDVIRSDGPNNETELSEVGQYDRHGRDNQLWALSCYRPDVPVTIRSKQCGNVLHAPAANHDGAVVRSAPPDGQTAQQWILAYERPIQRKSVLDMLFGARR